MSSRKNSTKVFGEFKLNSRPLDLDRIPPVVSKTIQFLDSYPFGELLETRYLANAIDYSLYAFHTQSTHPALSDYRFKHQTKIFWGSKESIKALKDHECSKTKS